MLVGVNSCGRCVVVASLTQIAKFPKKSQNIIFKVWVDLSRYIAPLLNEGNIWSFKDDLSGGSIKKTKPNLISKLLSLKTTNNIAIIISYLTEIQHLKFKL